MAFTTDFSQVQEHAEFKEQPYEMIVFDVKEEPNKNGKKRIVIDFVVRNDVKQEKQNAHLWDEQYPLADIRVCEGLGRVCSRRS